MMVQPSSTADSPLGSASDDERAWMWVDTAVLVAEEDAAVPCPRVYERRWLFSDPLQLWCRAR